MSSPKFIIENEEDLKKMQDVIKKFGIKLDSFATIGRNFNGNVEFTEYPSSKSGDTIYISESWGFRSVYLSQYKENDRNLFRLTVLLDNFTIVIPGRAGPEFQLVVVKAKS